MAAACVIACSSGSALERKDFSMTERAFCTAERQMTGQLKTLVDCAEFPHSLRDGAVYCTKMTDWTEGFFPGCLWYLYEYTQKEEWKNAAIKWTEPLEPLKKLTNHHDIGFLMYCSFGNAYRLTGNEAYKDVLVESARSLCTRFNEKIGCIESWN